MSDYSRLVEINFDGIVGPTHNYAGLSVGNLASLHNAEAVSQPRAAALQGIDKMRALLDVGLVQGFFAPLPRPNKRWLSALATTLARAEPHVRAQAWSASSMWAANAATVSPAPDTRDGRCHLTIANLITMPHRSHESRDTLAQMKLAFADKSFAVHRPIPAPFGDEGAANHMRLASRHNRLGLEIFVYNHRGNYREDGAANHRFPMRQHLQASQAIARRHGLQPAQCLFLQQSEQAVGAGAFHNDVVAVANENVLLVHEQAFADREQAYTEIRTAFPQVVIIEVPRAEVSLADAVRSYLFNAQLISLPDGAQGSAAMALVLPQEARETPAVWQWLEKLTASNAPIRQLIVTDLRQSMANGGGPACLRLRVVADPNRVDPSFLASPAKLDAIAALVSKLWPAEIAPADLTSPALLRDVTRARAALLDLLELPQLPS